MKKINPWYEPTDMLRKLPREKWHALMTRDEHGFLSGVIKEVKPKKILEVGIAFGGTTAMIIKSLELAGIESEIFSIDLNCKFRGKETGYMVKNFTVPPNIKHTLYTGKLLKERIEEIGGDIDFVILDTSHNIPGEILEFLTVLPFMSNGGTVVLHDVFLCNKKATYKRHIGRALRKICPKVLFSTVSGEKYYNYAWENDIFPSNIAAFKINGSTYNKIEDLFFSLSHLWFDELPIEVLNSYREYFSKYYSPQCIRLWDLIIKNQQEYKGNIVRIKKHLAKIDMITAIRMDNPLLYYLKIFKNKLSLFKR